MLFQLALRQRIGAMGRALQAASRNSDSAILMLSSSIWGLRAWPCSWSWLWLWPWLWPCWWWSWCSAHRISPWPTPAEPLSHTMQEQSTEYIQSKPNTAHNEYQLRILHVYRDVSTSKPPRIHVSRNERWSDTNRSIDCRKMLIPNAKRRAPLKNAPSNWDRCHPKVRDLGGSSRSETWYRAQISLPIFSNSTFGY